MEEGTHDDCTLRIRVEHSKMSALLVEQRGNAAYVTLNRPDVRNAFDDFLIAELTHTFRGIKARAVVLAGEGKAFCAGGDLQWMQGSIDYTEEQNLADADKLAEMFKAIDECPCLVIAKVHGAAFGGGAGLACVSDVVIAAEGTKFCFSEVKLGLAPAVISQYAVRKIGVSAARRYFLTAEVIDVHEAKRIGLAHEALPYDQMQDKVEDILKSLENCGPAAIAEAKKLIRAVGLSSEDFSKLSAATIARLRVSTEGQEGVRAFLEKRAPRWD